MTLNDIKVSPLNKDYSSDFYDSEVVKRFELTKKIQEEAQLIVDSDNDPVPLFWREKYINEAPKNWDKFYKRNNCNFFLDRHWIDKEFSELIQLDKRLDSTEKYNVDNMSKIILIEFGCGVGNSLIPLINSIGNLHCIGFDCSTRAISLLQERWDVTCNALIKNHFTCKGICPITCRDDQCQRLIGHVFDIALCDIPPSICNERSADFGLLIFVLSAIAPKFHQQVVIRCSKVLKSGAIILFRDYGRYDMAQLRFAKSKKSKIDENFYVRYDGTFAYYFTVEELNTLFSVAGFMTISNGYCLREVSNRKTQSSMRRIWIQAKFQKL
ncbi:hypothetical protein ACR3K2_11110 [Cryptosporidium serpentis]